MSATPRTDAIALRSMDKLAYMEMINDLAYLARQLECELAAANSALEVYRVIEHDRILREDPLPWCE